MAKVRNVLLVGAAILLVGGCVGATAVATGGFKSNWDWNNFSPYKDTYVGVRMYKDGKEPLRLGAAKDFKAGINGEKNDFDSYPIFNTMKASKDSSGNYYVKVAKHYEKVVENDEYTDYIMAPRQLDESYVEVKEHKIAAYKGAIVDVDSEKRGDEKMVSQRGTWPASCFTIEKGRDMAKEGGLYMANFAQTQDIGFLMTIEFATDDLQSIFKGVTSVALDTEPAIDKTIQNEGKTNVLRIKADSFTEENAKAVIPGLTSVEFSEDNGYFHAYEAAITEEPKKVNYEIKDSAGAVTSTVNCYELTFDGSGVDFSKIEEQIKAVAQADDSAREVGSYVTVIGEDVKNGMTVGLKGTSNELTEIDGVAIPKGSRPFSYRGIENFWGIDYEWCEGVQVRKVDSATATKKGVFLDVCQDETLFSESDSATASTPDYEQAVSITSGYVTGLKQKDGVLVPSATQTAAEKSLNDYIGVPSAVATAEATTINPVYRGGSYNEGSNNGAFCLHGYRDFANVGNFIGSRLGL